ncbi:alpha/beta fold hydrolase [Leptospira bouyouniensis]|uniref:alpha/beta fold hydrolase n=1 Tax=Leptospira bouyouniensis TaxID=2484911 RepID=UPI00109182C8|nr:alpha/beta hydrolase [Leptospira bouyouniensis]TGM79652.1 alpha/beta hydrolase [Leptospira bouyouniensis]
MSGKFSNANSLKEFGSYFDYKGNSIFYGSIGKGETLLLLHGYPFNSFDWNWVIEEFSNSYQVVFLDLLGMGFSDKPENHKYSFEEYVDLIQSLILKLNIKKVRILAHDLAVSVVQEMLATSHNLNFEISSIAFMNGGLFTDVYKPRLIQRLLSQSPNFLGSFISKKMTRKSVESSLLKVFGPHTRPNLEVLNEYWNILNYNNGKNIAYLIGRLVFEKVNYQTRWIKALKETKVPFCYICGPFDPNSGTHMAVRFNKEYPFANVYYLSAFIGHWPQIESPKEVVATYHQFQNDIKLYPK